MINSPIRILLSAVLIVCGFTVSISSSKEPAGAVSDTKSQQIELVIHSRNSTSTTDIGKVNPLQSVECILTVENQTASDIAILDIQSSCGCLMVKRRRFDIVSQNKESSKISVRAPKEVGTYEYDIAIHAKIKSTNKVVLHKLVLRLSVFEGVSSSHQVANLGRIPQDSKYTAQYEFKFYDSSINLQSLVAEASLAKHITPKVTDVAKDGCALQVAFDTSNLIPGSYSEILTLWANADSGTRYSKVIPVSFEVPGPFTAGPKSIYAVARQDKPYEGKLIIKPHHGGGVHNLILKTTPNVTVTSTT